MTKSKNRPVERVICAAGHVQYVRRNRLQGGLRYFCKGCGKKLWAVKGDWLSDLTDSEDGSNPPRPAALRGED